MKEKFELRKARDFGQVFNDTFTFFKANLKPLLRALFVICGVFLLIGAISSSATYLNMSSVLSFSPGESSLYGGRYTSSYFVSMFTMIFILMITQVLIHLVTLCYIAVYHENKGRQASVTEAWIFLKYYFWRVLGASILLGILTVIGFFCCIIPGVYFAVVFSLVPSIIVMENASFSDAFSKSFRLIRGKWWFVFGVLFVISFIVGIANSIPSAALGMVPVFGRFFTNHMIIAPVIIFSSILRHLLMLSYCLTGIAVTLCYFSLSEQKDGAGLMARIEEFGKAEPEDEVTGHEPTEEY